MINIFAYLAIVLASQPAAEPGAELLSPREMALVGYEVLGDTAQSAPVNVWGLDITRRAAEAGEPVALNNLGYFSATGAISNRPGLEEEPLATLNPERAVEFYDRAMSRGMLSAAMNLLDLASNYPELQIAPKTLSTANMMVGRGYALGNNVLPYDFDKANQHYLTAARLGNKQALEIIREIIGQFPDAFGELTPQDLEMIYGE